MSGLPPDAADQAGTRPGGLRALYNETLIERGFVADSAQERGLERLERLEAELIAFRQARRSTFKRLLAPPEAPRGVYLWGGVGRGKSFLMDTFFATAPARRKTRLHFHEFMRAVHAELDALRGQENPLEAVAERVAHQYRLICFDEFHVSDIADAMILYRLLAPLFGRGVVFVMTSNFHPDDLYPDGLHRDRILPAIELLKERLDLVHIDGGVDYRHRELERLDVYLCPLSPETERKMEATYERLAEGRDEHRVLTIEARQLTARRRAGGVAWFDFATLCGGPRSQNDYLELATRFHTLLLSDVPRMGMGMASEARRFTWLVDVLYDHRIKLIVSADAPPEELHTVGALAREFERTASRLREMQSDAYLHSERRAITQRF